MTLKNVTHSISNQLMKRKKLAKSFSILFITSVVSFSAVHAQASTPTTESINQLLSLTPIDKMLVNDVIQQAYAQNVVSIPRTVERVVYQQKVKLSDTQKKQLEATIKDYAKTLGKELSSKTNKQLSNKYMKAVQQTYTQEEVDAQIAFYGSAIGQQILQKQPQLLQSYMTAVIPTMQQQVKATMESIIPKLTADVNRVINK